MRQREQTKNKIIEVALELFVRQGCHGTSINDMTQAEPNADVDFLPSLKKVYDKYQSFMTDIIASGIQQGLLNKALDPALTALISIAVHHGLVHQWSLNRCQINGKE